MAKEIPYLSSYKNLGALFQKIGSAQVPEAFSTNFLSQTLGLSSSTDRPLIPFLRQLGFIDGSNKPTATYALLKNPATARQAIATATRRTYAPLFAANESAHTLSGEALRGLVAQVTGADEAGTKRTAFTFSNLVKLGDFTAPPTSPNGATPQDVEAENNGLGRDDDLLEDTAGGPSRRKLRAEFHYNLQIILPAHGTEETYLNIFNALRRVFQ